MVVRTGKNIESDLLDIMCKTIERRIAFVCMCVWTRVSVYIYMQYYNACTCVINAWREREREKERRALKRIKK